MTVIRTQAEIPGASDADLRETIEALSGERPAAGASRAKLESSTVSAIMSAQDADAKSGVPKGAKGEAKTKAELAKKARKSPDAAAPKSTPKASKPKAEKAEGTAGKRGRAPVFTHVTTKGCEGRSKVRADSVRGQVLAHVTAYVNRYDKPLDVLKIDEKFGVPTRGFLAKLIEHNHIAGVTL